MSKFNDLFQHIVTEMNVTKVIKEATCKPNTMLNQALLDAKKIPQERKAKVTVMQDGNTTGITYNVDSDTSAAYMAANIKANGGEAIVEPGSGVSNESTKKVSEEDTEVQPQDNITNVANPELSDGQKFAQAYEEKPFDQVKYEKFLQEGKDLGIEAVTKYLNEHSGEVSDEFDFSEAPEEEYFVEYALLKYNEDEVMPQI